jgi:choloylglycine hydrolase
MYYFFMHTKLYDYQKHKGYIMQYELLLTMLSILMLCISTNTQACTGIRLKADDGSIVYARTLEFSQPIESEILFMPSDYQCRGVTAYDDIPGLAWKSKYAALGANALGFTELVDGVNEKGLAGGIFYFPGYADFPTATKDNASDAIAPWQLLTWILTTCESVDQVKKELPKVQVSQVPVGGIIHPVHYIVHDKQGNSLVIEYMNGTLDMHDNPLGALTNSPSFDWHVTNLRNYINLNPLNVPKIEIDNISLAPFGQGSGMFGLPGDFTPPSRFVRAVTFSQSAYKGKNGKEALDNAFHILNLIEIPKGVVRLSAEKQIDYTQWTSAVNVSTQQYHFHTYDNRQIHMLDLNKLKNRKTKAILPMQYPETTVDLTNEVSTVSDKANSKNSKQTNNPG